MTNSLSLLSALGLSVSLAAPAAAYDYNITDLSATTTDVALRLDTSQTGTNGVVEIYDYRLGTIGDALGTAVLSTQAGPGVHFELTAQPLGDVLAVFYDENGEIADQQIITIEP